MEIKIGDRFINEKGDMITVSGIKLIKDISDKIKKTFPAHIQKRSEMEVYIVNHFNQTTMETSIRMCSKDLILTDWARMAVTADDAKEMLTRCTESNEHLN